MHKCCGEMLIAGTNHGNGKELILLPFAFFFIYSDIFGPQAFIKMGSTGAETISQDTLKGPVLSLIPVFLHPGPQGPPSLEVSLYQHT